jgi:hypothetical protein
MPCPSPIEVISTKFLLIINIKISQDKGQDRTVSILRNSLDKGDGFLPGGAGPQGLARREIFLDNSANPGKIVLRGGARRLSDVLTILL